MNEERLRKVELNPERLIHFRQQRPVSGITGKTHLMVNIMVICIIRHEDLERVEREVVSAVVVHCLETGETEQDHSLTSGHADYGLCDKSACGVKNETFDGMVVKCPVGVRNIEPVVP